jgi:hypothetical protein
VNTPRGQILQRVFLAFVLPLGGALLVLLPVGALVAVGVRETIVDACGVPMMLVAAAAAGWAAPRVLRYAAQHSTSRRVLAGVLGLVAANLVSRGLEQVGVQSDALSHVQGPLVWDGLRAMLHEVTAMVCGFGSLGSTAFLVLGAPRIGELRAAEQAVRPDGRAHG